MLERRRRDLPVTGAHGGQEGSLREVITRRSPGIPWLGEMKTGGDGVTLCQTARKYVRAIELVDRPTFARVRTPTFLTRTPPGALRPR